MPEYIVLNPAEGKVSLIHADGLILNGGKSNVKEARDFRRSPFYRVLAEAAKLHEAKNRGYADDADPFKNFRAAIELGSDPLSGILIRMSDKWSRLCSLRRDPDNDRTNEPIRDTLMDLGVYALIAVAVLDEQVAAEQAKHPPIPLGPATTTIAKGKCCDCGTAIEHGALCEKCFAPIAAELDEAFDRPLTKKPLPPTDSWPKLLHVDPVRQV